MMTLTTRRAGQQQARSASDSGLPPCRPVPHPACQGPRSHRDHGTGAIPSYSQHRFGAARPVTGVSPVPSGTTAAGAARGRPAIPRRTRSGRRVSPGTCGRYQPDDIPDRAFRRCPAASQDRLTAT